MCSFNITVDENKLAHNYPGIASEIFGQWLQKWVDDIFAVDTTTSVRNISPNAHTYEEMKKAICERIDRIEAGKAAFYSNEEVFSSIRERYDL